MRRGKEEGDTAMFVMLKEKSQKKDRKKEKKDRRLIKDQGESVALKIFMTHKMKQKIFLIAYTYTHFGRLVSIVLLDAIFYVGVLMYVDH